MIYQADLTIETPTKNYIGSAGETFKDRYKGHKHNFKNPDSNHTALSKYAWELRGKGKKCELSDVTWSIKARTGVYTAGAKFCDNCLTEKTFIMLANQQKSLNLRTEILNKCRHMAKFKLANL